MTDTTPATFVRGATPRTRAPHVPWRAIGVVSLAHGVTCGAISGVLSVIATIVFGAQRAHWGAAIETITLAAQLAGATAAVTTAGTALASTLWHRARWRAPFRVQPATLPLWAGFAAYGLGAIAMGTFLAQANHPHNAPVLYWIGSFLALPLLFTSVPLGVAVEMATEA